MAIMKRRRVMAALLIVLAILGAVALDLHAASPERVYSVAEVQRGLLTHPRQWANRTILMRGVFLVTMSDPGVVDVFHPPPYILVTYALYQSGPRRQGGISGLPLTLKLAPRLAAPRPDPLLATLRQLPWVGSIFRSHKTTTYRVTLLPPQQSSCAGQLCPDGQLDEEPS